jgi:hypothetical protein
VVVAYFKLYSGICLEGLWKNNKNPSVRLGDRRAELQKETAQLRRGSANSATTFGYKTILLLVVLYGRKTGPLL